MAPAHRTGLAVFVTLCVVAGVAARGVRLSRELHTPHPLTTTSYVGSTTCKRCHVDHYASWHRTFHRTMTQDVNAQSVLGDFSGVTLDYMGVRARMDRDASGQPRMTFARAGATERWQASVMRVVGSHRYQQYLTRERDEWLRLPIAWDVAQKKFIHMNGAFLTPDPPSPGVLGSIARTDYDRHVTRWNDNCIFCHNVRPNPGLEDDGRFKSSVAELGIACEACHGPGAGHVAANSSPMRRYALHLSSIPDPTIRNPARMTSERSAEVCGRCHGQRSTSHIEHYYADGDTFIPGEALSSYSTPLTRDTTQHGEHGVFASRFWNDGTPRLTAYEYQGYLLSPCRKDAHFSCESCHAMHAGDPSGQLKPEPAADTMCTRCHTQLVGAAALTRHTHHVAESSGSSCVACHMPKIVYGLVSMHVSHRIEIPRPAQAAQDQRPDACTQCHVDRTRAWAIEAAQRAFGDSAKVAGAQALAEVSERLLAGDPIERCAAANALGTSPLAQPSAALPRLFDAMNEDRYPAVRDIAARSARALITRDSRHASMHLLDFRATDGPTERARIVEAWRAQSGVSANDTIAPEQREQLRARAQSQTIEIGE